jgi:hypothetical protein
MTTASYTRNSTMLTDVTLRRSAITAERVRTAAQTTVTTIGGVSERTREAVAAVARPWPWSRCRAGRTTRAMCWPGR